MYTISGAAVSLLHPKKVGCLVRPWDIYSAGDVGTGGKEYVSGKRLARA